MINDIPCPHCGRRDGTHAEATYRDPGTYGFIPWVTVSLNCCSHCVEAFQAHLDQKHPFPRYVSS